MKKNGFSKNERLCSSKLIDRIFAESTPFLIYPYRVSKLAVSQPDKSWVQVVFSAPKKRFRNATDRNTLKRRMREAYRLQKHPLVANCEQQNQPLAIFVSYVGKQIHDSEFMHTRMFEVIKRLNEQSLPTQ